MDSEEAVRLAWEEELYNTPDGISDCELVSKNVGYCKILLKQMNFSMLEATKHGLIDLLVEVNFEINRRVEAVGGKHDA